MEPHKKPLIVFDLVSTLTDAGPRYVRAFADVCEEFGFDRPDHEEIMEMLGNKNLKDITDHFLGTIDEKTQKSFMNSCNTMCDAMLFEETWHESLFPHVKDTLEKLHDQGYGLGIYTGTRENALDDQIHYHDIASLFDPKYIRGKDNIRDAGVNSRDLKAAQLESIVEQHSKDTGQKNPAILVIGDSVSDAEAAKKMGYFFVGFASCPRKKQRFLEAGEKYIIADFQDLPDLLSYALGEKKPETPQYKAIKKKHRPKP